MPHRPNTDAPCASGKRAGQRVAECVPRKAGEQMTAQPFGHRERGGQRDNPPGAARPEQPRQREAKAHVDRHRRRKPDDRDRQQPAEGLGVDQKRVADPVKSERGNSRTRTTSRSRRRNRAVPAAGGRAIDQPDQHAERDEHDRPDRERLKRQGWRARPSRMRSARAARPTPGRRSSQCATASTLTVA